MGGRGSAGVLATSLILFLSFLGLLGRSASEPLCTDSRAPFTLAKPLAFCPYNGSSCCNSTQDAQLQMQFQTTNVSDPACGSILKSILCARCDQFSAELFTVDAVPRPIPVLCNSTVLANSSQSNEAQNDYCSQAWDTCRNISIYNSPFAPSLQTQAKLNIKSNFTKLTDLYQSKTDFCKAFGGASGNDSVCYSGEPVQLNSTEAPTPPPGLCLEKIGSGSYLNMVAHPDGSNRAFFSTQKGYIYLATVPEMGSGKTMDVDESSPFLDLTDQVYFDTQFGMMGMAFHPNFAQNGRLFASFNCDKTKWLGCTGRCSCNSDVNCDPSKLPSDNGATPCQYQTVVAEYSANGSGSDPSTATSAKPMEFRRIFTMGLPFTSHHGGQILFGPADGYLYFMTGDGGGTGGDPYNFSQNKKSLLGKIMRLDVDNIPSVEKINKLGLWGNYSIPKDNPFSEDAALQPEIYALGMRNPWRCSFDSLRPSYFVCADVGQDEYEEVDLITKGGNYGWRIYEGPKLFAKPDSATNSSLNSSNFIFPIMGYSHSEVNKNLGSASITGGYFYRSMTDPCTYGRYLYGDLYAGAIWAGIENPEDSGNYTSSKIPFACAKDSPIKCDVQGSSLPSLGYIFSFGEDNKKDVYVLASSGVYRVVRPSRCSYTCSKENLTDIASPGPSPSSPSSPANRLIARLNNSVLVAAFLLLPLLILGKF
ncbi:HIPL1 protein [Punica granatum]|uniref:Glucose/Sorbosone dehydrogenase domain-containing protein n=2 Tax=Punica granatum TaxID=22663 RepID=A0A218VYQ0_PUNGR|nr:HIPL1 protein [Punica granatum]OWM65338.1 hypothetical protein CDL15_Pgr008928 [Punica granatum]PKI63197.1 hypothetical protein CRG98_016382 [Punica granatum]